MFVDTLSFLSNSIIRFWRVNRELLVDCLPRFLALKAALTSERLNSSSLRLDDRRITCYSRSRLSNFCSIVLAWG